MSRAMVHDVLSAYITISPTGDTRLVGNSNFNSPIGKIKSETQVQKILTLIKCSPVD